MAIRPSSARRYAEALFAIAIERGTVDAWSAELVRIASVLENPDGLRILTSPALTLRQKRDTIDSLAGPFSKEVSSLITILLQRKRVDLFPALAAAFADRVRQQKGIEVASVTSAVPLADAERTYVAQWLERTLGQSIELHTQVDPEIIGGVVARVGDRLIDASVRGKLESLRRSLHHV